jgi:hypothetical protein
MLNFPNAPIDGELSTQDNGVTYQWQASKTRWITPIALGNAIVAGTVVQVQNQQYDAAATGGTQMPADGTIPQITEGDQFMALTFTPKFANSKLRIDVQMFGGHTVINAQKSFAIFRDGAADAIGATYIGISGAVNWISNGSTTLFVDALDTVPIEFTVNGGASSSSAGTFTFNGTNGNTSYGAIPTASITITEIQPNAVVPPAAPAGVERPVGAMVFGYDPNPLYPGTWTQIPEGTFIMATVAGADPAGGSNDAAVIEHDHSINDPNHNHTVPGITANSPNGNVGPFVGNSGSATYNAATSSKATGITINSQGVAGTNLNKPLYKGVQAWERTA